MPYTVRLYRLAALVAILWLVRDHAIWLRNFGDLPVGIEEVKSFFPTAAKLDNDQSARAGLYVLDDVGKRIGYVLRTSPVSDKIIGYAGPTDTLIALNTEDRVLGIKVRRTGDTKTHLEDVLNDAHFMNTWNGMGWGAVAEMDLKKAGVEGTSGSSLTSLCIAESIVHRIRHSENAAASLPPPRIAARDIGLTAMVVVALALAFTKLGARPLVRRGFQIAVIGYIGFVNGDLIAQSLLAGWATSGIAWRLAPGLTLFVAAALLVPAATKRQIYCTHLCPHGVAQEWLGRISHWKIMLPRSVSRGLKWLPPVLLVFVILVVMLDLPFDLAGLEPFDAYIVRSAGVATIAVAIGGLVASFFVPMAYCKYGCPTGALLEFVRTHGRADHFGTRDVIAGFLLALAFVIYWQYRSLAPYLV